MPTARSIKTFLRLLFYLLTLGIFFVFPAKTYALETGFQPATTCSTNGSSCQNMNAQDSFYNSWVSAKYEEVIVSFAGFGVPDNAIIDDIQIKLRARSSLSLSQWYVYSTFDGTSYEIPKGCSPSQGICVSYISRGFDSINQPNMAWLKDEPIALTGAEINSPNFRLKLWQSYTQFTKNTDIDTLLFNIRYRFDNIIPENLPPNAYFVTRGFDTFNPGLPAQFFYRYINVPYARGKLVLSSTPDGKGDVDFADILSISQVSAFGTTLIFNNYPPGCIGTYSSVPPIDISSIFSPIRSNYAVSISHRCYVAKHISPLYLVVIPETNAPTPFLDLPWNYSAKGLTFADAALSINSYFDHSYPLLSSGLFEPDSFLNQITTFKNENSTKNYSSHDGYDYGNPAGVRLGDPVLAAASGTAEYVNSCSPCGNMILIDHGNGYQTRYMHMQKDGLIVSTPGVKVNVTSRQQIGKVGATGNVFPAGNAGAHIHFAVVEDRNKNGNFSDNLPDGLTDPFGWQSSEPDPWANYSFFYNGMQKTGNKSYFLWKNSLGATSNNLSQAGGSLGSGRYTLNFSENAVSQNTNIQLTPQPLVSPSNTLSSIGPTLLAIAKDQLGNAITSFLNPFTLIIDFTNLDLSRFNFSSLSIYSSEDGITWKKENTTVDPENQKASATLSHFSYFALMAERLDTIPPSTTVSLSGNKGNDNWFNSDVALSFSEQDNQGGLGVDYTLYRLAGGSWDNYSLPITATDEGSFKYEFYSVDKDENVEEIKTVEFGIDKTPPVITSELTADGTVYVPGTWTNKDVVVTFLCTDSLSGVYSPTKPITISGEGENQIADGECKDNAGNTTTVQVNGINIDKTPPVITVFANPSILWPPNGKLVPVKIDGTIKELNPAGKTFNIKDEYDMTMPEINEFGDTIFLQADRNSSDFNGREYMISVDAKDLAGNKSSAKAQVIVPHDQSKKEK